MATGINPASMFGGGGGAMTPQMGMQPPQPQQGIQPGQQGPQPQGEAPAAQQLLEQVSHIMSLLKQLATTTPEMSKPVDVAINSLKEGMVKTTQGMLSRQGEGSQPAYA